MRLGSLGKVCVGGLLLLSMATGLAVAQTPVPIGAQFQINTFTTGSQQYPSVGVDAGGNFVVVWISRGSEGTDASGYSIQGQRYDSAATSIGG